MKIEQVANIQEMLETFQGADAIVVLAVYDQSVPDEANGNQAEDDTVISTLSLHKDGEELNELTLASIYTAAAQNSIARTVDEINAAIENAED